jgi:hypothetical protein
MVLDAARGLAAEGREVVLTCRPAIVARFVLLGAENIPGVSLVTVHDG